MLDFFFIHDGHPTSSQQLNAAGSIEYEEFEKAQEVKIIEKHLD
jgi:hypothetical protein